MARKKEYVWYRKEMPFTAFGKETGVYAMYGKNTRHKWYGIKGIYGLRITTSWGYNRTW